MRKALYVIEGREELGRFVAPNRWHAANLAWLADIRPAPSTDDMRLWTGRDPIPPIFQLVIVSGRMLYELSDDLPPASLSHSANGQMTLPLD
jgi:hypothetical protein